LAVPLRLALLGLPALLGLRLPLLIRNEQVSLTSARRHGQASPDRRRLLLRRIVRSGEHGAT
jgi:hypothetical protein